MKSFTAPKKWALTATLLAVLGFNVSFNSNTDGIASADFASTSSEIEVKIHTAKGVIPVKYLNGGDDKVLAIIPKTMTEGKICESCGYETIPFTTKDATNIDTLNVELMKVLEAKLTPIKKGDDVDADGEEGEEEIEKPNPFDKLTAKCRREKSKTDQLSCLKDKFLALMKSKAGKKLEPDDALSFYKKEIQTRIISEMADARRIAARARRSTMDQNAFMAFNSSDEGSKDPNEMVNQALRTIEELLAETPERYESVRRTLLVAETDILKYQAAEVKQVQAQAKANMGTQEGLYLTNEGTQLLSQLEGMRQLMGANTTNALGQAGANGLISYELESQYKRVYQEFNTNLVNAMNNQTNFLDGIMTNGGIDLSGRLAAPGRGIIGGGVVQPDLTGVSNRGNLSVQQTISPDLVAVTDPQTGRVTIIPKANLNLTFGTAVPATADSLNQRLQIRQQYGQ